MSEHVRIDRVELRDLDIEGVVVAHDAHLHTGELKLIALDVGDGLGHGRVEAGPECGGEPVDQRLAAARMAVLVGLLRGEHGRTGQEARARHVVCGDDALDLDALLRDIAAQLLDVGDERRILEHNALALLLDDEHFIGQGIVRLIGVQLRGAKIVDAHGAGRQLDGRAVGLLHGSILSLRTRIVPAPSRLTSPMLESIILF